MNRRLDVPTSSTQCTGTERRLAFFLSFRGSLRKWRDEGILDREILLPLTYVRAGVFEAIDLFTYDDRDAVLLAEQVHTDPAFARIVPLPAPAYARKGLGALLYSFMGPYRHRATLKCDMALKTNQISGSWAALVAKLISGRPLALRLGYLLSRRHRLNRKRLAAWASEMVERAGFYVADAVIVTSADAEAQVRKFSGDKVKLLPTYVDPEVFAPKDAYDFSAPLLYVGRFTPQKNLRNLVLACAALKHPLHLIGSGAMQRELEALAERTGATLSFLGRVPNTELAGKLREYSIFVLPSLHEGLPKVLIEAMAVGMVCVGTNVPGTTDLITDGVTGYLAEDTSATAIATALRKALAEKRVEYGQAARQVIEARFGIAQYAQAESEVLLKIGHFKK